MTPEEQKAAVLAHLARREAIAAETRERLEEPTRDAINPLANVDPAVRAAAEDEFYAAQGRRRYRTSDGRTLFLTPEEIAHRRRARGQRRPRKRSAGRYYGAGSRDRQRKWMGWAFNAGVVGLAMVVVWLILH